MAGKKNGRKRPDFVPEPLKRETRGALADVPENHFRLNRQNIHDRSVDRMGIGV
jgi:hypothetical protein